MLRQSKARGASVSGSVPDVFSQKKTSLAQKPTRKEALYPASRWWTRSLPQLGSSAPHRDTGVMQPPLGADSACSDHIFCSLLFVRDASRKLLRVARGDLKSGVRACSQHPNNCLKLPEVGSTRRLSGSCGTRVPCVFSSHFEHSPRSVRCGPHFEHCPCSVRSRRSLGHCLTQTSYLRV